MDYIYGELNNRLEKVGSTEILSNYVLKTDYETKIAELEAKISELEQKIMIQFIILTISSISHTYITPIYRVCRFTAATWAASHIEHICW